MRRYRPIIAVLLQLAFTMLLALAPARAEPTHIAAWLVAEGPAAPGETVMLALSFRPEAGWHGYWSNPGDAGFGMKLAWTEDGRPTDERAGAPLYPVPQTLLISGLMNHVYKHDYAVLVPYRVPAQARPGTDLKLAVRAEWLACTDTICVPEKAVLDTALKVASPGEPRTSDPRFDGWRAKLPAPLGSAAHFAVSGQTLRIGIPLPRSLKLDALHVFVRETGTADYAAPQEFRRDGDLLIAALPRPKGAATAPATVTGVLAIDGAGNGVEFTARPGPVPTGGQLVSENAGANGNLAPLLLAALAGGLLLNVMPCVFPILSLKALSLARAGESPAEARREGLAYTAGVVIACSGLGALLLALRAGGSEIGWAFQLQEPGIVVALLFLAVAITANLAGLFEFAVPGFARAGSPQGAFATGLLAAFVATPCTGPFMAAAMGAALLLPAAQAMALFAALGLGLALPFLIIAVVPAARRLLPRPGRWMDRFRRIMAVPMGLTALALAWLAWRLGGPAFAALTAGLALVMVAILAHAGRLQRRGRAARGAVLAGLAAVALVSALALPRTFAPGGNDSAGVLPSQPFSQAALDEARASGAGVFLYFTADWCLTCKVNERIAIERESTRDAFARGKVVTLKGDWTRRDPAITRYLTAMGAAGVPLYVWYPPQGEPRVLPQLLTPEMLAALPTEMSAIEGNQQAGQ